MEEIIRGTTPTLQYTFDNIQASNITNCYLTVKQANETVIELPFSRATVDDKINFKFTQEETLSLKKGVSAVTTLDWVTNDGTRGRSQQVSFRVEDPGKDEVI